MSLSKAKLPPANLNWKQQCPEHCCAWVCCVCVMLPSPGAGRFSPYLFSSLNCLHATKFCQQLHQGDPIKGKWTQCSSSTNAHNLNCTAVGQSGSNSALGNFLGRNKKKKKGQLEWQFFCQWELNLICSACCNPTHPSLREGTWDRDCNTTSSPCGPCWWTSTATTPASTGSCRLPRDNP